MVSWQRFSGKPGLVTSSAKRRRVAERVSVSSGVIRRSHKSPTTTATENTVSKDGQGAHAKPLPRRKLVRWR